MLSKSFISALRVLLIGSALLSMIGCSSTKLDPKYDFVFVKNPDPIIDPITFVKQMRLEGHDEMIGIRLESSPYIKNGKWKKYRILDYIGGPSERSVMYVGEFDLEKHIGFEGALKRVVKKGEVEAHKAYGSRFFLDLTFKYSKSANNYNLTEAKINYSGRMKDIKPSYKLTAKDLAPLDEEKPLRWMTGTLTLTEYFIE